MGSKSEHNKCRRKRRGKRSRAQRLRHLKKALEELNNSCDPAGFEPSDSTVYYSTKKLDRSEEKEFKMCSKKNDVFKPDNADHNIKEEMSYNDEQISEMSSTLLESLEQQYGQKCQSNSYIVIRTSVLWNLYEDLKSLREQNRKLNEMVGLCDKLMKTPKDKDLSDVEESLCDDTQDIDIEFHKTMNPEQLKEELFEM